MDPDVSTIKTYMVLRTTSGGRYSIESVCDVGSALPSIVVAIPVACIFSIVKVPRVVVEDEEAAAILIEREECDGDTVAG